MGYSALAINLMVWLPSIFFVHQEWIGMEVFTICLCGSVLPVDRPHETIFKSEEARNNAIEMQFLIRVIAWLIIHSMSARSRFWKKEDRSAVWFGQVMVFAVGMALSETIKASNSV